MVNVLYIRVMLVHSGGDLVWQCVVELIGNSLTLCIAVSSMVSFCTECQLTIKSRGSIGAGEELLTQQNYWGSN